MSGFLSMQSSGLLDIALDTTSEQLAWWGRELYCIWMYKGPQARAGACACACTRGLAYSIVNYYL